MSQYHNHQASDVTSAHGGRRVWRATRLWLQRRRDSWIQRWDTWSPINRARALIFLSTFFFSWVPVFFVLAEAKTSPINFVATVTVFTAVLSVLVAGVGTIKDEWTTLREELNESRRLVAWGTVCRLDYLCFAIALYFVNSPVAVVLAEIWPVVMILVIAVIPTFESLRRPDIRQGILWLAFPICFVGSAILALGELGVPIMRVPEWYGLFTLDALLTSIDNCSAAIAGWPEVTSQSGTSCTSLGVLAAIVAGVATGFHLAYNRQVAHLLSNRFKKKDKNPRKMFCESISLAFTSVLAAPCFFVAAWLVEDWSSWISIENTIWTLLGAGAVTAGALTFRLANQLAGNNINVIYYLMPIFSLMWLILLSWLKVIDVKVPPLEPFLIGAAAILTANLMAAFSVDRSLAFKGLILSLWCFGGWVYVRAGTPGYGLYYESVVATVTVYVLLLSFRTDRLVRQIRQEEADTIWLWRATARNVLPAWVSTAQDHLYTLIAPRTAAELMKSYGSPDLQKARTKAYGALQSLVQSRTRGDADEMRVRIDILVNSKQQRTNMGELMAIFILA